MTTYKSNHLQDSLNTEYLSSRVNEVQLSPTSKVKREIAPPGMTQYKRSLYQKKEKRIALKKDGKNIYNALIA